MSKKKAIEQVEIISLYQPLYSVHEKKYIGVEALSRGKYKNQFLAAGQLFCFPKNEKEILYLNKKCIASSLKNLKSQTDVNIDEYTIFLNIDSSLMDNKDFNITDLEFDMVTTGISSRRIVIELIESRVKNFYILLEFVKDCRKKGFLIALDDVGAGYSSLQRIVKIKPDIIKIDKGLVNGVSVEFHKREACRSLIELSHNIGALSLAEGVETINDALECQDLGVDILQGFFFSKPQEQILPIDNYADKILLLIETWNFSATERDKNLRNNINRVKKQAEIIHNALSRGTMNNWNKILSERIEAMPDIECAYIINQEGIQLSISVLQSNLEYKKHFLFTPAKAGTDHSQKYYFLRREEGQKWYISDPYISRATGNICRTVSLRFVHEELVFYLCLDINN